MGVGDLGGGGPWLKLSFTHRPRPAYPTPRYAEDQALWFADFSAAYIKMTGLGVTQWRAV